MDHMTFDEFKEVLAEDLKESLYERGYKPQCPELTYETNRIILKRARGFMPRKSIERYLKVAIILKAGIDNDFVYSLKVAGYLQLCV